jgi:hypothetical protein
VREKSKEIQIFDDFDSCIDFIVFSNFNHKFTGTIGAKAQSEHDGFKKKFLEGAKKAKTNTKCNGFTYNSEWEVTPTTFEFPLDKNIKCFKLVLKEEVNSIKNKPAQTFELC